MSIHLINRADTSPVAIYSAIKMYPHLTWVLRKRGG